MNIRVIGKRIKIPITSVMNPGIKRKNPPIGVKIVFRKLSAVGSKTDFLDCISSSFFNPWLRNKYNPIIPEKKIQSMVLKAPMLPPIAMRVYISMKGNIIKNKKKFLIAYVLYLFLGQNINKQVFLVDPRRNRKPLLIYKVKSIVLIL